MPWTREGKIFCVTTLFGDKIIQNCLKNRCNPFIWLRFITETRNSKKIVCVGSWFNNNKKTAIDFDITSLKGHIPNDRHFCLSR